MPDKNIVILISGNGSNLQAFIKLQNTEALRGRVVAVISNKADVYGLHRAAEASIPAITIEHTQFDSREAFDAALLLEIDKFSPDLVILAGFMRILTANFVTHYRGRLLNIHPSLLPKYPGLRTHQRAIAAGEQYHGASVHYVTEKLDGGPLIAQSKTSIEENETVLSLQRKVQRLEHNLYPATANLLLIEKIRLIKDTVYFENEPLQENILF